MNWATSRRNRRIDVGGGDGSVGDSIPSAGVDSDRTGRVGVNQPLEVEVEVTGRLALSPVEFESSCPRLATSRQTTQQGSIPVPATPHHCIDHEEPTKIRASQSCDTGSDSQSRSWCRCRNPRHGRKTRHRQTGDQSASHSCSHRSQ